MNSTFFNTLINNFLRRKYISLINIFGLTLGFTSFILLLLFIQHEYSYDKYNNNIDDICRIRYIISKNNVTSLDLVVCSPAIGPTFKEEIPEVLEFARLLHDKDNIISYNNIKFKERNVFYADSSILKIFTFNMIKGDSSYALKDPNTCVISESIAEKYFGKANPINKVIKKNNKNSFTVTGVFQDIDSKSHIKIDILYSMNSKHFLSKDMNSWDRSFFYTYLLLQPGSLKAIESKIPSIVERNRTNIDKNSKWEFVLQPLKKVHLYSDYGAELERNGNGKVITILIVVAFLILIIAWINYVNLSIALSMERAKEVGVKKVVGFYKKELLMQFIFESLFINLCTFIFSIILATLLLKHFNALLGIQMSLSLFPWFYWLIILGFVLVGTIFTSLYSGWVLASFNPVEVIKGKFHSSPRVGLERKFLLVFQYIISISLIIGSISYYRQVNYMLKSDLGINIDNTIVLDGFKISSQDSLTNSRIVSFKNELLNYPNIKGVCLSNSVPVKRGGYGVYCRRVNQDEKDVVMFGVMHVDSEFIPNYKLELLHGRNFVQNYTTEKNNIIISETGAKKLGFTNIADALNQEIKRGFWTNNCRIIGITKDFKNSLKRETYPLMIHYEENQKKYVSIMLNNNKDIQQTIKLIQEKWNFFFPEEVFNYYVLKDEYNQLYRSELQQGRVVLLFTVLSIIISSIGLIGLSSLIITQRAKEVSLRKVLGQETTTILFIIYKYFIVLVIISAFIAIPTTYYLLTKWIENYPFHIKMSPLYGIIGLGISILITIITISYFSIKTVKSNPAAILRDE